ncbi:MAG TPA: sulfatase-like hydrolase/transferase, partial [Polyangia bacterium]|nr:sulfatase-like hydrolase/transferase [Polyangia bacterium]
GPPGPKGGGEVKAGGPSKKGTGGAAAVTGAAVTGAAVTGAGLPAAPEAHLVLITIDALRPDHLGAYGYGRRVAGQPLTPAIDGLAARGVRFERAYAQAPHTAYSIASLLSSEYVHSTVRLGLPAPATLADLLGGAGWRTEAFFPGGLFFNGWRELGSYAERHFGFGRAVTEDLDARTLTDLAIARLEEIHREGEPRTFLWLHYFDAHEPYVTRPGLELGDTPLDRYDSEIAYLDRELGRLLGALGRLDRPVVLALTADHGEEFKEHGGWYHGSSLYEEQVRVPLLIVAPGVRPRVVAGAVELVDLAPTLLGLVGQPAPAALRGDDLAAVLVGRAEPGRPVYSEMEGRRMVVAEGAKLVHDVRRNTWELYDLVADPRELVNLYDREPERAAALKRELQAWIEGLSAAADDEEPVALKRVRLGDREAVPELAALIADPRQPEAVRAEAARLAGAVEGYAARDTLRRQLVHPALALRAEAALALGELTDRRALATLAELLDEPRYRLRAAIMLGRLRDARATPALIEAMGAPDETLRRRAIHYLGFVGDERAIAPLLASMAELRTRYLAGLSLGRIGARVHDGRVLPSLLERLEREPYEDNRAHLVCALGFLGDAGGLAAARGAALLQPPVKWATETLVRLGAIERGVAFGVDFAPGQAGLGAGIAGCRQRPPPPGGESTDEYAGRTTCQQVAARAEVRFSLPGPVEAVVFLRLAPRAVPAGAELVVRVNDEALAPVRLDPGWQELRFLVPKGRWRAGENRVGIALGGEGAGAGGEVRAELDHLLVIPR